ncbi:MAG TPA: peptide deformylase [Planctomycetaceae bacterium]|nr:peptide deformylase [Planctomycetaceae bacterium]
MQIVRYPHPALRRIAKPVRQVNGDIRRLVEEMIQLMHEGNGIGLAAPQVAVPLRIVVMNPRRKDEEPGEDMVFINPKIKSRRGVVREEEGCLSLPELYAQVRRAEWVRLQAQDRDGNLLELELEGLPARVIQHETDHLQGILFIDKLETAEKIRILPQIREFERQFRHLQKEGQIPSNAELKRQLDELEAAYCEGQTV